MTLNTNSMSVVEENTPSKEPSPAQGHASKLELSDGSSIYAKLVVSENLFKFIYSYTKITNTFYYINEILYLFPIIPLTNIIAFHVFLSVPNS